MLAVSPLVVEQTLADSCSRMRTSSKTVSLIFHVISELAHAWPIDQPREVSRGRPNCSRRTPATRTTARLSQEGSPIEWRRTPSPEANDVRQADP